MMTEEQGGELLAKLDLTTCKLEARHAFPEYFSRARPDDIALLDDLAIAHARFCLCVSVPDEEAKAADEVMRAIIGFAFKRFLDLTAKFRACPSLRKVDPELQQRITAAYANVLPVTGDGKRTVFSQLLKGHDRGVN
jgi:hypothetical protein